MPLVDFSIKAVSFIGLLNAHTCTIIESTVEGRVQNYLTTRSAFSFISAVCVSWFMSMKCSNACESISTFSPFDFFMLSSVTVSLDYTNCTCLRHLGHALDHQLVRRHGRVLRERQTEDRGHHHLLDQLLPERHGAVLVVVGLGEASTCMEEEA